MEWISAKEAAAMWGIQVRMVQTYCKASRIPGAKKYGNTWMVPSDARKPEDPRKSKAIENSKTGKRLKIRGKQEAPGSSEGEENVTEDYRMPAQVTEFCGHIVMSRNSPDAEVQDQTAEVQQLMAAEMAYLRGDFLQAKQIYRQLAPDDSGKIIASCIALAAAMSCGDYELYNDIEYFLEQRVKYAKTAAEKKVYEMPLAMAAVAASVPEMAPDWLKSGDFKDVLENTRPFVLYLYAQYLHVSRRYEALLAVAESMLLLYTEQDTFTQLDIYMHIFAAIACYKQGQLQKAGGHISEALALAMPFGFITPFAEMLTYLGGLVEMKVSQHYSIVYARLLEQCRQSAGYWVDFHNHLANSHTTTILTLQEHYLATLLREGLSYAEAAERMHLSIGRIRNITSNIYGKLGINRKSELKEFLL